MAGIAHSPDDDPGTRPPLASDDLEEQVEKTPRLVIAAAAAVATAVSVANFSLGHPDAGVVVASLGLLAIGGGLSWLSMERRRVREAERELTPPRRAASTSSTFDKSA